MKNNFNNKKMSLNAIKAIRIFKNNMNMTYGQLKAMMIIYGIIGVSVITAVDLFKRKQADKLAAEAIRVKMRKIEQQPKRFIIFYDGHMWTV